MPTAQGSTGPTDAEAASRRRLPLTPRGAHAQYAGRLDAHALEVVRLRLDQITIQRLQRYLPVLAILHLLMLLFIDLPSIQRARSGMEGASLGAGEPVWLPVSYLLLRLVMLGCWTVGIVYFHNAEHRPPTPTGPGATASADAATDALPDHATLPAASRANLMVLSLISVAGLGTLAGVTVLDQLRSGDILAFTLAMLIASVVLLIRQPVNLIILGLPFGVFLAGLVALQEDTALLTANLANSGVMLVTAVLISSLLYNAQFRQHADGLLLERANHRLDQLSLHDQLTGLPNRRRFTIVFEHEVERIRRERGRAFLLVADLDNFKTINDRDGHPAGDAVLRQVSAVLRDGLRAADAVARWGGEEFLLLLVDTDPATAISVTERLRTDIEMAVIHHDGQKLRVTASFGIAEVDASQPDPLSHAYSQADRAMYAAKQAGRNQVVTAG